MKRFIALTFCGLMFTGFTVGISSAQDKVENPPSDQQERREASRQEAEHLEELAGHAREIRAEINRVQDQFDKAREAGKEGQIRELRQFLEELHEELLHVEQELQGEEREHHRDGEKRSELDEHRNALRHELGELEKHIEAASNEGNEEEVRELKRHFDEILGKLKDVEQELNGRERHEHPEEHDFGRHDNEEDRRKLEYFHEVLIQQLKQNEGRLREAQEAGDESAVEELAQHQENLFWKLREVEEILGEEDRSHDHEDDAERHELEHRQDRDEHHEGEGDREHHDGIDERLEHLHIAIEHLRAGGFGELAHLAAETAEKIHQGNHDQRHHDGQHDQRHHEGQHDREDISREDVVRHVLELEEHLHRLHQELERVKHFLEQRDQ